MPDITLVPIPKYQPLDPYHFEIDNLPIEAIEDQIFLVNAQVDINQNDIESSIGSAGSLANRLNQSLKGSGKLKTAAVDTALHSISSHTDDGGFVRMTDAERSKLSLVESQATRVSIALDTISTTYTWPSFDTTFTVTDSDTIAWRVESGEVLAETTFAKSLITIPSYDVTPVQVSGTLYKTTSADTAYKAGTLRVYVNGLRLSEAGPALGGFYYTETTPASGTFTFNSAPGISDVVRIDFDQPTS